MRRQAQEAAEVLLKKGLDLPNPALEGRARVKASGKKGLEAEAKEIAFKIMSSGASASEPAAGGATSATAEVPEGSAKDPAATSATGEVPEGSAKDPAATAAASVAGPSVKCWE